MSESLFDALSDWLWGSSAKGIGLPSDVLAVSALTSAVLGRAAPSTGRLPGALPALGLSLADMAPFLTKRSCFDTGGTSSIEKARPGYFPVV